MSQADKATGNVLENCYFSPEIVLNFLEFTVSFLYRCFILFKFCSYESIIQCAVKFASSPGCWKEGFMKCKIDPVIRPKQTS